MLPGARVLDLFAGSGALGLEAVSRGAASAVLVERDPALAAALRAVAARLPGGERGDRRAGRRAGAGWDALPDASFDLAFVDPPFAADLWAGRRAEAAAASWPRTPGCTSNRRPEPSRHCRADWMLHREGRTREVRYALYRRWPVAVREPVLQPAAAATLATDPAGPRASPIEPASE